MKYLLALTVLLGAVLYQALDPDNITRLRVDPEVRVYGATPIGVNLGTWTSWGAEQLPAMVLKNSGFEGTVDRALICVRTSGATWFADDTPWTSRPLAFWSGARFEILSGPLAGASGKVVRNEVRDDLGWFEVADVPLDGLRAGDIISVTKTDDRLLPRQWWFENRSRNRIAMDCESRRPESAGSRSIVLAPDDQAQVAVVSYVDALGDRAGKLLPLKGKWRASVWAKGTGGRAQLHVQVRRHGTPVFVSERAIPGAEWKKYEWKFQPDDSAGPPGIIEFRLEATGAGGRIWLDDASLEPVEQPATPFRPEVVDALRELRPGYLRDWQGQLGDTWANRIADPQGRRSWRYRPGADETDFGYSVPEFLALCRRTGARPWLTLPPTLSVEEWETAGRDLRRLREELDFPEILVEFGNENWNELFRPAGILSPETLAEVVNRAIRSFETGSGNDPHFRFVVGGHAQNPDFLRRMQLTINPAVLPAIAPYYLYHYPAASRAELFPPSVSETGARDLAIYEINAHTLDESAPLDEVNRWLESPEAGAALAWHALTWMEAGVVRQCVYTLAGFDAFRNQGRDLVRLFGITRDLAGPARLRPTGQAIAQLNRVVAGELHRVSIVSGQSTVKGVAFRHEGRWSVALVSSSPEGMTVSVEFPEAGQIQLKLPPFAVVVAEP